ncbi:MAG: L,D-transpeptidase family protein [Hungatella sp.]|nr:L,D-transpeptidase family protein [Hungatella sp.]
MKRTRKMQLTLLMTGVMALNGALCSLAAPNVGPAFDPNLNPNVQEETVPDAAPEENNQGTDAAAPETESTPQSSRIVQMPRLQTTLLLSQHQWSQPFINDQWCDAGDQTFYSISIFMENAVGNVLYRAYTATNGWTSWVMNGQQTNIPPDFAPIEAIQVRFTGAVRHNFDVYYAGLFADGKQTDWAKNGASAGSMNKGIPLRGFRLAFFAKGDTPGLDTGKPLVSDHADGIQTVDGALRYIHGDGSNYTGWGWLDNERYYFVDSFPVTGWQYIDGYKYYFAEDGKLVQDLEPIIGAQGPFLLRINKEMNTTTVYVQDGGNGYIIPLKSFLCSCGDDTPVGTFRTPEKYRWRLMNSGVSCQYATRLGAGLSFLFHSIIYDRADVNTMWADTYNYLGVARSAGCIRFTSGDAKWIFDNCPIGTTVEVYNSLIPGPYERPAIEEVIPNDQRWDPTDPVAVAQFQQQ